MRFHFGNCRHDEAQNNWNEICKLQDIVRSKDNEIFSLNKVMTDISINFKDLQKQIKEGSDSLCRSLDVIRKKEIEIEEIKKESNSKLSLITSQEKVILEQIEHLQQGSIGYEKLKKQHHFALEKIKHLQQVIEDMNKRSSFDDIPVVAFKPRKARKAA